MRILWAALVANTLTLVCAAWALSYEMERQDLEEKRYIQRASNESFCRNIVATGLVKSCTLMNNQYKEEGNTVGQSGGHSQ